MVIWDVQYGKVRIQNNTAYNTFVLLSNFPRMDPVRSKITHNVPSSFPI
jgi:hypothetical protein